MKYEKPILIIQYEYEDIIRTSLQEGDDKQHQDGF